MCLSTLLFALCSVFIYITKITGAVTPAQELPGAMADANPNLDEKTQEVLGDYWTIAIFGIDSRGDSVGKGSNADVQILCSINRKTGDIRLASVYRDTYLMNGAPDTDNFGKIGQSYFHAGPAKAVSALNSNLDMKIDDYVTFNWKSVADMINLLGGVDIELSKAEFYYINAFITETVNSTGIPSQHLKEPGVQHLDGVQAVSYMRLRQMDTDFMRTERQRRVISQVFEKVKSTDLETLYQLIDAILPQVHTSMDSTDLLHAVSNINSYNLSQTTAFPFTHTIASVGKSGDCVIPNTLESNVEELHRFFYDEESYLCSGQVREISREIIKRAISN